MPPPGWPLWIVFGVLLLTAPIMIATMGVVAETSREQAERERHGAGRSVVVVGTLVDTDATSGMPQETPVYLIRLPAQPGEPERTLRATGPSAWGFPPSDDHPQEREFLVTVDDAPRVLDDGAVGTLHAPTLKSAAHAETQARSVAVLAAISRVGILVALIATAGTAIVLHVRRARARRAQRRLAFVESATHWVPPRHG